MCMGTQGSIAASERGWRQALNDDYEGSGYDKGHLYPVYHTDTKDAMLATSTLTNAAPQNYSFNRGQWKKHEENVVTLVQQNHCSSAYIVTGIVPSNQQINGRVRVALYYWSALCCLGGSGALRSAGYIGPDNNGLVQNGTVAWLEHQLSNYYSSEFSIFRNTC